jgi:cysteine-rich repeat protein
MRIEIGVDTDADGVLDPGEVTTATFVCNGVGSPDGGTPRIACIGDTDCPLTTSECTAAVCSNGFCDVANVAPGVVCSSVPMGSCNGNGVCVPFGSCGDGIINPPETCDDGNFVSDDGCSFCVADVGFTCAGTPSQCRSRTFTALGRTFHYFLGAGASDVVPPESGGGALANAPVSPSTGDLDMCDPTNLDFSNKIIIAKRGPPGCTFYQKAINAAAAGAVGIIVYNNLPTGIVPAGVAPPDPMTQPLTKIPLASISLADGAFLVTALARQSVDVTWLPFVAP